MTVPCFLGTAQQGRKGYNTMYIATTAAEAAILANYISARQLYQLAKANLALGLITWEEYKTATNQ